ncbi:GMP/IMP nucleotidase [Marinobacterium rhizophilum]|uniref:GMP/IMP nucleotidase n=1 Tax=Marinobacterium rhizophilum TaxID=420402 RepID=A0ABY5HI63_9GAMM|nr:GMP/IMP nucleotidase [Marinobacterium rhizophilum]UTW10982.1 GMP/IMP nucleotidase [Marinobacterium rhizophilum]
MLDWRAVDTVLLDMDGTLLDLHFDSYFWLEHLPLRYAQLRQLEPADAREWLHQRITQEQGTLNWYCLDYWSEQLGVDITALKREVADRIGFRPQVKDFLQRLRQRGMRSVIVTNAHRDSLNIKLQLTGLDALVDGIVSSHDFRLPKEDIEFWTQLQAVEPFDPARTLLVDDSLAVLRSAQRYGIAHLLSIVQPDSQAPARNIDEFRAIDQFDELFKGGDQHNE